MDRHFQPAFLLINRLILWMAVIPFFTLNSISASMDLLKIQASLQPEDQKTVAVNPPGFVWLPIQDAEKYSIQFTQIPDFSKVDYEITDISFNLYCPSFAFTEGTWYWRYSASGVKIPNPGWSQSYSFVIPKNAVEFYLPEMDVLLKKIPANHPKLFIRPEKKLEYANAMKEKFSSLTQSFLLNAEKKLQQNIVSEKPVALPANIADPTLALDVAAKKADFAEINTAVETASNLAFAYLITNDAKYAERAREWLLSISSWPLDGKTSFTVSPDSALVTIRGMARVYTWIYPFLTDADKKKVIDCISCRGDIIYKRLLDSQFTILPYNNLNELSWQALGETAIVFISDISQAKDWLMYAMNIFYTVSPVWGDNQGGWHQGIALWQRIMDDRLWWMDILKNSFGIDGMKKPFYQKAGDYALYTCPVKAKHGGFGDEADTFNPSKNGMVMGLLAARTNNPYWLTYAAGVTPELLAESISYRDMLRAVDPSLEGKSFSDIPQSKIFGDTGIAALHSHLDNPDTDTCILFKSSPFGTQSLGYNAQNSFILSAYGEPLLIPSGHKDWYGSPHQQQWMWETFSENTITVNGEGQIKHSPEARGKILRQFQNKKVDYIAGDASAAYGNNLSKFVRHIFFVKPNSILMVDELESPQSATFEYHLHGNEPFEIKNQGLITAKSKASRAKIAFVTPAGLEINQVTGFTVPSMGANPEQAHLVAKTKIPSQKALFVTAFLTHNINSDPRFGTVGAILEGSEGYAMNSDSRNIALVYNPERIKKKFGMVETDAAMLLIIENYMVENDVSFLASNATFFAFNGKTIKESKTPGEMFISKEELSFPVPTPKPADSSKQPDGNIKDPTGK